MEEPQGLPMEEMKNGGIPQRYKNMGFTHVGQKKQGDGKHKWKVLAKKGDQYKVVQGGWRGMQDFSQHHSEKRKERFWDRMGGRNSSKATDPFSPLYWHKKFGTWEEGGEIPQYQFGSEHYDTKDPNIALQKMQDYIAANTNRNIEIANRTQSNNYFDPRNIYDRMYKEQNRRYELDILNKMAPRFSLNPTTGKVSITDPYKLIPLTEQIIPKQKKGGSTFSGNAWYTNGGNIINDKTMFTYPFLPMAQVGLEAGSAIPPPPMPYEYPDYGSYNAAIQQWTSMYGDPSAYMPQEAMATDTIPSAPAQVVAAPAAASAAQTSPTATLNPYTGGSIYDFMQAQGKAPDYQSRKSLANALGVQGYRGTAEQNTELLNMIRENPAILLNYTGKGQNAYTPSNNQGLPGKTKSEKAVANSSENVAPEVTVAQDTIKNIVNNVSDTLKNNINNKTAANSKTGPSDNTKTLLKVLMGISGAGAAAGFGYLTYMDYSELMNAIKNNELGLTALQQEKLAESLSVLRNNSLNTAGNAARATFDAYTGPQESMSRLRGRLLENINNRLNANMSAVDAEEAYLKGIEEAKEAARLRRVEAGRKGAAARWSKVKNVAPVVEEVAPVVQEVAQVADQAADLVPASEVVNASRYTNPFRNMGKVKNLAAVQEAKNALKVMADETPWIKGIRNAAPKVLKFMKFFEEGGELPQAQFGFYGSPIMPTTLMKSAADQAFGTGRNWFSSPEEKKVANMIAQNKTLEQRHADEEANDSPWWWELLDPTGISSWDDLRRVHENPNSGFWDYAGGYLSVVPVIGKLGKTGKAVDLAADAINATNKVSKARKAVTATAKFTGKVLDHATGASAVRWMDRMNPWYHGAGYLTNKFLAPRFPIAVKGLDIINDMNRGNRGVNAMSAIYNQYVSPQQNLGPVANPQYQYSGEPNAADSNPVWLKMPNGQILKTTMSDSRVNDWMNKGLIDTSFNSAFIDQASGNYVYPLKTNVAPKKQMGGMPCYECGGMYAYGGYTPEIYANGGISINPANKGKFTAKAQAAGMGVQAYASKVLNAPEGKFSASTRKQANFARNASKWKKQDGGLIEGDVIDVSPEELEMLKAGGYTYEILN